MEGDDQEARMIRATMLSCLLALALTCWGCSLAAWHSDDPIKRACVREAHNEALSTAGIEFTVIDAVAMSPCTPPSIFEWMRGDPSMSTESYDSGAPRYASR